MGLRIPMPTWENAFIFGVVWQQKFAGAAALAAE
jgi:hypothetical protein